MHMSHGESVVYIVDAAVDRRGQASGGLERVGLAVADRAPLLDPPVVTGARGRARRRRAPPRSGRRPRRARSAPARSRPPGRRGRSAGWSVRAVLARRGHGRFMSGPLPRAAGASPALSAGSPPRRPDPRAARAVRSRRGSCRLRSARNRSATSWLNPRLTTTRSAARSVRFAGNVYAGTCQPRSRTAFETSKTEKFRTSSRRVNAKTGSSSPRVMQLEGARWSRGQDRSHRAGRRPGRAAVRGGRPSRPGRRGKPRRGRRPWRRHDRPPCPFSLRAPGRRRRPGGGGSDHLQAVTVPLLADTLPPA